MRILITKLTQSIFLVHLCFITNNQLSMKKITFLLLFISTFAFSQCPQPDISEWNMTSDGANFDGTNFSTVASYEVEYNLGSSFTPGDGTASTFTFESFPATLTGLESSTLYYFTIRSICTDGTISEWTDNPANGAGPDPWQTSAEPFEGGSVLSYASSQVVDSPTSLYCQVTNSTANYDYECVGSASDQAASCPDADFTANESGTYVITLTDAYGDGWIGSTGTLPTTLNVFVNGDLVLDQITFEAAFSQDFTFEANQGDVISTEWSYAGTWFYETGFSIISESSLNNSESATYSGATNYYTEFVPADWGLEGTVNIRDVQLGIWFTDSQGNPNENLPTQFVDILVYKDNSGGIGGTQQLNISDGSLELVAGSVSFPINPEDHLSMIQVPISLDMNGNSLNGEGIDVLATDEYVVQFSIYSGSEANSGYPGGVICTVAGNYSDPIFEDADASGLPDTTAYPYPASQSGGTNECAGFFNLVPNYSILINLVVDTSLSNEEINMLDMKIYPNPVNGNYVTIQTPVNGVKYVEVFDITGKRLINTSLSVDTLEVSSLSAGMYLVKVTVEGQSKTSKLVVR